MTTQLDRVFEHELEIITSLKGVLSKKDKIHFCKWVSRLQYICRTKHERVTRNRYLELLSLQIQLLGHLEEPFTHIPPDGNLEPIPIYWLERLQKARASLNRARSPQASNHDRSVTRSPQFSQTGGRRQPYYPQEHVNPRVPNEEYSHYNTYEYTSSAIGDRMYAHEFQPNNEVHTHGEYLPSEFPSSLSKGASFASHSLVEDYNAPMGATARRDTPVFDKFKTIKKGSADALDASSTRDSFPDVHYLQLNRSPMNEELSNRINHLLKHELPADLQAQATQSFTICEEPAKNTNSDEDTTIITELQAVPESVPNTSANSYKLMASAVDPVNSSRQTFTLSKSYSGQQPRDAQALSVEPTRSRKVLTASRVESSMVSMQEQRYVVAATIEAPISSHTSRSGTAHSTRSTRESETLVEAPIMTASQHGVSSRSTTGSVDQDIAHRGMPQSLSEQGLTIPEAHPLLSPGRSNVSYVATSIRAETLSPVSRPVGNAESIMYRTQRDYADSEPSSVIHNKDVVDSAPLLDGLMSGTNISALTDISANISTSLVSPGIKTLVVKPYTVASVPELTAIQMSEATPRKLNIPDTVTATSEQDESQTKGDLQHAVICVPNKAPSVPDLIQTAKKNVDDIFTGTGTISEDKIDMRRVYLEGTHQDDYLIKPVRTDFVPHVIPTQSPRHRNCDQVPSVSNEDILSANSPTHSPKHGDKKPRVRLLPDAQPALEPEAEQEVDPSQYEEPPGTSSTRLSPRRVAGQSLYSTDLASSHMESLASSISHSALEATGINPDLIIRPPPVKKDPAQMSVEIFLNKSRSNSSFVAPDLADIEDCTEQSLYFVVTDKRGQDVLSPDSLTCEAAGRRLIDSKPRDADETAMTAIMGEQQVPEQITSEERKTSTDFDEADPPMIICDMGETPPTVIRSKTVAPPMSFEENVVLLQNAKQDGCISYSRSRAGSRAISLSRRSMSIGRFSEAPSI